MDEVRKNKALVEQILARSQSITSTMVHVNDRLSLLNKKMDEQKVRERTPEPSPTQLMDLHQSVLNEVVARLTNPASLCALGGTCRVLNELTSARDWEALCRQHWGITQTNPLRVRCMDAALIHGYAKIDNVADSSVVWEQRLRGNPWRNVYRDRTYGTAALWWRIVIRMLRWLRMHCHPQNVSGVSHRFQLYLALNYMDMCTCTTQEKDRIDEIIQYSGIPSLVALLGTAHPIFKEQAAAVLANIMCGSPENKEQVLMESHQGKRFADHLQTEPTGATQQLSRALVNMWAESPIPEVTLYNSEAEQTWPALECGVWCLQEYSLRGDTFSKLAVLLSFSDDGEVFGGGSEMIGSEAEQFVLEGWIDHGRKWELTKVFQNRHRVTYKGFSDLHGAYGVYFPVRDRDSSWSFLVSSETAPKVFRLFRDPDMKPLTEEEVHPESRRQVDLEPELVTAFNDELSLAEQ